MLEGDPWGTSHVDLQEMEIHVYNGREKSTDNLGRAELELEELQYLYLGE
jgi:hypothetical protein